MVCAILFFDIETSFSWKAWPFWAGFDGLDGRRLGSSGLFGELHFSLPRSKELKSLAKLADAEAHAATLHSHVEIPGLDGFETERSGNIADVNKTWVCFKLGPCKSIDLLPICSILWWIWGGGIERFWDAPLYHPTGSGGWTTPQKEPR